MRIASDKVWKKRLEQIDSPVKDIRLPSFETPEESPDQDEAWCDVRLNGDYERFRFHDYGKIYNVPGLYEKLFYNLLECCSPSVIANLLNEVATDFGADVQKFRVLDVGAGNGMVGDELAELGVKTIVGIDIIPEAKTSTERDRPGIYQDYLVADLTKLSSEENQKLRQAKFNCLTNVAALGFGDMPPLAFLRALEFIEPSGWLAFNIKEAFLRGEDQSGFDRLIQTLTEEQYILPQCYRRYQHRLSVAREPLFYVVMIAQKMKEIPEEFIAGWAE